jgi:hypothetical protein
MCEKEDLKRNRFSNETEISASFIFSASLSQNPNRDERPDQRFFWEFDRNSEDPIPYSPIKGRGIRELNRDCVEIKII